MSEKEKKSWINEHWVALIAALFSGIIGLFSAYFAYNQHSRDAMTDFKIKNMEVPRPYSI
jgi:CHASE1-domain containing sensor protein